MHEHTHRSKDFQCHDPATPPTAATCALEQRRLIIAIVITGLRSQGGENEGDERTVLLRKPFGAGQLGEMVNRLLASLGEVDHE